MPENIFEGIFDGDFVSIIDPVDFLICIGAALLLGIILAFAYAFKARYTRSFLVTLAILHVLLLVITNAAFWIVCVAKEKLFPVLGSVSIRSTYRDPQIN